MEGDEIAFHGSDLSFRSHGHAHRRSGQMLNVQLRANGGLSFGYSALQSLTSGPFHQSHHAGGGIYQQAAGAHFSGCVGPFYFGRYFALHSNDNFHDYHTSFLHCIIQNYKPFCQETGLLFCVLVI